MKKQTKKVTKAGVDYSKVIGGGLIVIGLAMIALLTVVLVKILRDEKKYTISYHSDDKLAEQIIEQSTLDGTAIGDTEIIEVTNYITVEKALDIALDSAGLERSNVWDIDVELEHKFGQIVYEVSFDAGQYEYEYYINAETGEIIKSFKEIDF